MTKEEFKNLCEIAIQSKNFSLSMYSNFRVGAAVLTKSGKIFSGTNIENPSYSLTICAERVALFKAISEGENQIYAIAISTDKKKFLPPCGACRQVIFDLAINSEIILINSEKKTKKLNSKKLLPFAFGKEHLK